jgi:phenylacetate-CoA ligase
MGKVVKNIPWVIRNYLFNPYKWQAARLIKQSDTWTKEQIKDYQYKKLKDLLEYAYANVPYYNNSFRKAGFTPDKFKKIEDLDRVPYLTKDDIRNNNKLLISSVFPPKYLMQDASGGTTGLPVNFYNDSRYYSPVEWVYMKSLWQRAGYAFYDRYAVFRGEIIKPSNNGSSTEFWRYDKLRNCIVFSAFEMNDDRIPIYLEKLKQFKPKFIHSYPSVLFVLANYIEKNKIKDFPQLKGIFLGSETLYTWQRDLFKRIFNARLYSWYGHRERCILAGEQDKPYVYEVFPTYGYAEIINENGYPCTQDGEQGELIGTSFNNYACPLIRYKTHDIAEFCLEKTSHRNFMRIKNIKGRLQDFFVDNRGSMITVTTSWNTVRPIMNKIVAHQFVQDIPGKLTLNIEPISEINYEDIIRVKTDFNERFPNLELNIKKVNSIPRTVSGKFRYFVQNIDIEFRKHSTEVF